MSAPDVAIPAASVRAPRHTPGVPQIGAGRGRARHLDHEHRGAVHEHRVAGARTPTLTASAQASIVPATTGVPAGSPVSAARLGGHPAGDLVRPGEARAARPGAISAAQSSAQPPGRHVVERIALAGRVVVQHVLAGQPRDQERAGHVEPRVRAQSLGLVAPEPEQLGPTACEVSGVPPRARIASAP